MADSASWWARKLGNPAPSRTTGPAPVRQAVTRSAPPAQQGGITVEYDERGVEQIHAADAMISWKGGPAMKEYAEMGNCPECDSPRFFSRTEGMRRGPAPAPQCFDCGYPVTQSGSGAAIAGSSSAPARKARMGPGLPESVAFKLIGRV